jgi:hypothetical protein
MSQTMSRVAFTAYWKRSSLARSAASCRSRNARSAITLSVVSVAAQ